MLSKSVVKILPDPLLLQLADAQHFLLKSATLRDVGAHGQILSWLSMLIHKRKNGCVHPVNGPVLRAISDVAFPNAARSDRGPEVSKKLL